MSLDGITLRLHPDESIYPSWYSDRRGPPECPCFISKGTHVLNDIEYDAEAYQFYFRENLAIGLGGVLRNSSALGYHEHDVEAVIVLFDKESQEPRYVYYKAHGLGQGTWRTWGESEKGPNGFLVAYVALGSHAIYPTGRTVRRILGFANDRLSDEGPAISIPKTSYVDATYERFGDGIAIQDSIPRISNTSISQNERTFLPFVNRRIRTRARAQVCLNKYRKRPLQARPHHLRLRSPASRYIRPREQILRKPSFVFF